MQYNAQQCIEKQQSGPSLILRKYNAYVSCSGYGVVIKWTTSVVEWFFEMVETYIIWITKNTN